MQSAVYKEGEAARHPLRRALASVSRAAMRLAGALAALLVVAETVILFAGVVARYALNAPLVWSDELASILFVWLAMLGAALALERGEHMAMTALVSRLPARWQTWCRTVAAMLVCVFVGLIIVPAIGHAQADMAITTSALEIPVGLRTAALPAGAILMLIASLAVLVRESSMRQLALAFAVLGAIGAALWLARDPLAAMGNYNLLVFFVLLLGAAIAAGIPIAFAFGVATVTYLNLAAGIDVSIVVNRMDEGMSQMILLAVPLFVLLGALLDLSGLARALIEFMASLIGHLRGGLQFVLLVVMFLVSGVSGSKVADMAAVAPALFPEMKERGCDSRGLVALLVGSAAMTETIPPSIVLITIGAVCGISITALFTGGLLPACVASLAIAAVVWFKTRSEPKSVFRRAPPREIARAFVAALPALALPVLIRSAVVEGVATATEVATVGVAYTIVAGLALHVVRRHIDFRRLYPILVETASLSGAILFTIGMATAMSWALTQSGFSASLAALMESVPGGRIGFLAISIVVFLVLGSVLEGIPAVVLFGPLLFPVARALGIGDVHYAIVVVLCMGVGLFAPPFGVGFYAACMIGKTSPDGVMRGVVPYLVALLLVIVVVAFVPWISSGFLPS
ncbi:TRAP transporter large permease subunit [Caballeronia sp. INDeC2]|uniref:TRAP transporter large permease n=1 Tax=Caballeronia sp. INDeC2 TaxID=2921747 RepID=UPI002028104E|nr:TRAP transporter large permease subunit [Caballeronia sp. INDeC2]